MSILNKKSTNGLLLLHQMYHTMFHQSTGKTTVLQQKEGRRARKVRFSEIEWEAFRNLMSILDAKQDYADVVGIGRVTLYRILNNGHGHSTSIERIRQDDAFKEQLELVITLNTQTKTTI